MPQGSPPWHCAPPCGCCNFANARDEAEQANRAQSQFLTPTSHDLRTPLSAVIGFAQVLQADRALTAGPRQQAQRQQHRAPPASARRRRAAWSRPWAGASALIDAALAMGFAGHPKEQLDLASVQATAQAMLARKG